jgi:hypothetical protein
VRDLIWTVIFIWVAYKLFEMFKGINNTKSSRQNNNEGEVKINQGNHHSSEDKFKDAEYVDYEEIK